MKKKEKESNFLTVMLLNFDLMLVYSLHLFYIAIFILAAKMSLPFRKSFLSLSRQGKAKRLKKNLPEARGKDVHNTHEEHCYSHEPSTSTLTNASLLLVNEDSADLLLYNDTAFPAPESYQHDSNIQQQDRFFDLLEENPNSGDDDDDNCDAENISFEDCEDDMSKETFHQQLQNWAVKYQISHVALSALLLILQHHVCFKSMLPVDARTFLKTSLSVMVRDVHPGQYSHIGIAKHLRLLWTRVKEVINCIELLVGIDGIPLFKSSRGELWPIMASVFNVNSLKSIVFPVGIYYGSGKPQNCQNYLEDFVAEATNLVKNGILLNGTMLGIRIKGFCMDAPAKAFILSVKGHSGYSSCTRCKEEGEYYCNRITFPDFSCIPRTHEEFLSKADPDFNVSDTPLTSIPDLNFITSFPLDYMHLVCLGVMRTLMYTWKFGPIPLRFQQRTISKISVNLLSFQPYIPSDFNRRPRSLLELKHWKATEFRQFLLYTGPLALRNILLPHFKHIYFNFLSLHISFTILLSPKHCLIHRDYAVSLLSHFLQSVKVIYGQEFLTHNFHGLLHIADDVLSFGPLDRCSAFQFENFLCMLKKLVRKGNRPLQQVIKRLSEIENYKLYPHQSLSSFSQASYTFLHTSGPLLDCLDTGEQYKCLKKSGMKITTSQPNNCCRLTDGSIVVIENIVRSFTYGMCIIGRKFKKVENFYEQGFCNSIDLGICKVSELDTGLIIRKVADVTEKLVLLHCDEVSVAYPLLHLN